MPHLKLKIVSGSETGQNDSHSFTQVGGSIGRSEDCDWTLLDSDRFVSKKHLVISFRNQQFILTDVSSNGVIVNNSSDALGRGNEHILQTNDSLVIGKHVVQVEEVSLIDEPANPFPQQESDGDLLGLIMGADAVKSPTSAPAQDPLEAFNINDNQNPFTDVRPKSDQGLEDILSQPIPSQNSNEFSPLNEQSNPFDSHPQASSPFAPPSANEPRGTQTSAGDSLIPDDWEMFDSQSNDSTVETAKVTDSPQTIENTFEGTAAEESLSQAMPSQRPEDVLAEMDTSFVEAKPVQETAIASTEEALSNAYVMPATQAAPEPQVNTAEIPNNPTVAHTTNDDFFSAIYEKLGLSKEFKASIDREAFAEDIATILLSTTQGLMSLLASRTAFKQESRLSSTLIQPRSNNPIKFSIDPVDTLEMLLVKKKKGYMSVGDSYDEAMEDIQLHQMAFMSGLQGSLNGVLAQLAPEAIEQQVNKKTQRFMGLNSNSQCWQIYKEKQPLLAKSVKENLNEVLGNYFSDAYQSQIDSFKKEK